VHCARTDKYTLLTCHRKRGRDGIDDSGVLRRGNIVAVRDAWAPYNTYLDPDHQLCCAHYREFRIMPISMLSSLATEVRGSELSAESGWADALLSNFSQLPTCFGIHDDTHRIHHDAR
jgi:hypothetical protein